MPVCSLEECPNPVAPWADRNRLSSYCSPEHKGEGRRRYFQEYHRAHPPTAEYVRDRQLRRVYGITSEDYGKLLEEQGGVCAICGAPPNGRPLSVDHSHATGRRRGLLCNNCNTGLGMFQDDPKVIEAALVYVHV